MEPHLCFSIPYTVSSQVVVQSSLVLRIRSPSGFYSLKSNPFIIQCRLDQFTCFLQFFVIVLVDIAVQTRDDQNRIKFCFKKKPLYIFPGAAIFGRKMHCTQTRSIIIHGDPHFQLHFNSQFTACLLNDAIRIFSYNWLLIELPTNFNSQFSA